MKVELPGRLLANRTTVREAKVSGPVVTFIFNDTATTEIYTARSRASSWVRFIPGTTAILTRQELRSARSLATLVVEI